MAKVHKYFLNHSAGQRWWLDGEGRCFFVSGSEIVRPDMDKTLWAEWDDTVSGFSFEGLIFRQEAGENGGVAFQDICQLEDGRIIVLVRDAFAAQLKEMDPDSGRLDTIETASLPGYCNLIAADCNNLLLLREDGIWNCNMNDGKVSCMISFDGTSYVLKDDNNSFEDYLVKEDFRLRDDGEVELLWSDGTVEFLNRKQVDEEREILVMRLRLPSSWMKEQVVKFNQTNENYYVVLEERGDSEPERFMEQTELELGAGRGADLIGSDAVNNVCDLMEKGVFVDLAPLLESSGIREEDYFPAAFSGWKRNDKIYGVNYTAEIEGFCIDSTVAGNGGISGAEDMVDRLLDWDGEAVFLKYADASDILGFFLRDSENLWDMVDLEGGICDFGGDLFGKILEAAQRYGYEDNRANWECISETIPYHSFYCFNHGSYLMQEGKTVTGYLFDDGGRPEMRDNMLAININSSKKEGAWEFIRFLLGDEVQSDFDADEWGTGRGNNMGSFPVSRSAFEKLCERHSGEISDSRMDDDGQIKLITGLSEERKEELRTALEEARPCPLQTRPLIRIIQEEAGAYFSGAKSIDEVRATVENRVQLYLNERR